MEADLRGRSWEELVCVGPAFGVLQCVIFFCVPLDCFSVRVHEMSPQAPMWVTSES